MEPRKKVTLSYILEKKANGEKLARTALYDYPMAVLAEETGEVARVMARRYGDQSFKPGESDTLADELADVMWVVMAIANQSGIDLVEAFARNLEKKTKRDACRHLENPKLRQD